MQNYFDLKGKKALVTGGSSGIGYMIAEGLLGAGAMVYIASRKMDACHAAAEKLSQNGTCIPLTLDLSKSDSIASCVEELAKREEKLHILVNNAGKTWGAPFEEFPDKGWDLVLDVNLKGVFNLTRALLPLIKGAATKEQHASIVNIGSMAATSAACMSAYSYGTSKAAVHQLTRILAFELAPLNITVNAIAPGRFPSKMTKYLLEDEQACKEEIAQIPLRRFGETDDMAALAVSLCTRAGAYMTGNIIPLDGGANLVGMEIH